MNRKGDNNLIFFICGMLLLVIGGFIIGYFFSAAKIPDLLIKTIKPELTQINSTSNLTCINMSFDDTVHCLNYDLSSWYFFNISNTGKDLTDEQFRREGGVCRNAALWYASKMQERGFGGDTVWFEGTGTTVSHRIAIVYKQDLTEYCIIDQDEIVGCNNLDTPTWSLINASQIISINETPIYFNNGSFTIYETNNTPR